jgi:ppGpp synthetase/RelA/SpoT-type nucleotidyltranferase
MMRLGDIPNIWKFSNGGRYFELMNKLRLSVVEEYDRDRDLHSDYAGTLHTLTRDLLAASRFKYHSVQYRLKDRTSLARKVLSDLKYSSLTDVADVIGIRVITYFADEVDVVAGIIRREFMVEDEKDRRTPGQFGYRSLHQVVRLNSVRSGLLEYTRFAKLKAEIQIRSILDHAWAEIAHDRAYKGSALVPTSIPEQFSRLAALLQDADRQFEKVRDEIESHASTTVWKIARAEGKTERVGDFTLYASKARFPAGSQSLMWDLVLYLNTPVTNRLGPDNVTDVVAFLDGVALSRPATKSGALIFSDALQLAAIEGNEFRVRVAHLRVHAAYLGTGTPIVATLEAHSRVTGDRVRLAEPLEVGHTHRAMSFRVIDQNGDENLFLLTREAGINHALAENPNSKGAVVNLELCFREAINGAFRTDLQEAGVTGSAVDSGTRFVVGFLGVPNNVELYITAQELRAEIRSDSECKARLLEGNWAGSESAVPMTTTTVATVKRTDENVQIARLQKSGNSAMAVWEWVDRDPLRLTPQEVRFGVVIVAKPGEAAAGTTQVYGNLGPISAVGTASSSSPIPRFSSFGPPLDAFSFL